MKTFLAGVILASSLPLGGCAASTHAVQPSTLGVARRSADMLAMIDKPGPIEVETVSSTTWAVSRAGLINLDSPKAKAAGLVDGDEPIEIFFHAIHHPTSGLYLVDTGVEKALRDAPTKSVFQGLVAKEMHLDRMGLQKPLGDWLAAQHEPLKGVFFTHLHLDHVSGAPDLPKTTPLYAGPGETTLTGFLNLFTQGTIDRALDGLPAIHELAYQPDADKRFEGVIDVFGDGSFWAIWTPGHTPGSSTYLARTPKGPVLMVGDTCHTRWGWENSVEPGGFTDDHAANLVSLVRLKVLVDQYPKLDVRLGHQRLKPEAAASSTK